MNKTKKTTAKSFIMQIQKYLTKTLKVDCRTERPLGEERWSHKADVAAEIRKPKMSLFVEVEGQQPHPDTNVTKYWYWMEKNKKSNKKVVLIHVFGNIFYDNNYKSRTELCSFIADKIKSEHRNFVYIPIPESKQYKYNEAWELSDLLKQTKNAIRSIVYKKTK